MSYDAEIRRVCCYGPVQALHKLDEEQQQRGLRKKMVKYIPQLSQPAKARLHSPY